jgi:hypothetical protein
MIIKSKGGLTDLYIGERRKPVSDAKKVPFQALLFLMSRCLTENAGVSKAVRGSLHERKVWEISMNCNSRFRFNTGFYG